MFWEQLDQVLNSGNTGSRLSDVATLKYSVQSHLLPQDEDNAEEMVNGEKEEHFLVPRYTLLSIFVQNINIVKSKHTGQAKRLRIFSLIF